MRRPFRFLLLIGFLGGTLCVMVFGFRASFERGPVSDIKLFASQDLVVYCQDVSAESARCLPLYRPPGLQQVRSFSYEGDGHARKPELLATFWHTWYGHTFPEFQISSDGRPVMVFAGIPAEEYQGQDPADMELPYNREGSEDFSNFGGQVLFCFDADEMTCTVLRHCNREKEAWWVPFHLNFQNQYFPAVYMTDTNKAMRGFGPISVWGFSQPSDADRKHLSYQGRLVSLHGEGTVGTIELRDDLRGYSSFVIADGSIVSHWGPTIVRNKTQNGDLKLTEMVYAGNWLCHDGKVVDDLLQNLLAVTPDTKHVFYSRWKSKEDLPDVYLWQSPGTDSYEELKPTSLWVYEPESGLKHQVLADVGIAVRVSRDSARFGILDGVIDIPPSPHFWSPELQGCRGNRNAARIAGARIFDLGAHVLEEFTFGEPIVTRAYDWDIDAKILAYYDEASQQIVVKSLTDEIISKLEP